MRSRAFTGAAFPGRTRDRVGSLNKVKKFPFPWGPDMGSDKMGLNKLINGRGASTVHYATERNNEYRGKV